MSSQRFQYVHPLVAAAAVSLILVSVVGLAKITGLLPALDAPNAVSPGTDLAFSTAPVVAMISNERVNDASFVSGTSGSSQSSGETASGGPVAVPEEIIGDDKAVVKVVVANEVPKTAPSVLRQKSDAATAPSVYFHVLDEAARQRMTQLAPALEKNGIALAGIKVVPAAPAVSDLRYFHPTEKAEALKVQAALVSLGLPAPQLKKISGFEPVAKRRQYEFWLAKG